MNQTSYNCDPKCVRSSVSILGDKWTPLLILSLIEGPRKFSELENELSGISPRTLSQRLECLADAKVLSKNQYQNSPARFEYQLSDKGRDLYAIIKSMNEWGAKYGTSLN